MTSMLSFLLLLQLGSLVIVNGYTLDDPEALGINEDQDDAMGYLDYLQGLRDANLPLDGGVQKRGRLCFAHGKSCVAAPSFCCAPAKCRCNIFGSNCKCARPGLFAQFG
jgi:hypothetical protein